MTGNVDGVFCKFPDEISTEEMRNYVKYAREKQGEDITSLEVKLLNDDEVTIHWLRKNEKFERIRRITGYLVGTIDRWNDAKRAEERERVKHI